MKTDRRTQLREAAFLLLFRLDFYPREDMPEQIKDFFDGEDSFTDKEINPEALIRGVVE